MFSPVAPLHITQDGFKSGLKNAFEFFINLKHNSSASLIAKYVDRKLKGEKGVTEQEVEQSLDQVEFKAFSVLWCNVLFCLFLYNVILDNESGFCHD